MIYLLVGCSPESTPLRQLDDIIAVTEKSVIDQKQLRRQLGDYTRLRRATYKMSKTQGEHYPAGQSGASSAAIHQ